MDTFKNQFTGMYQEIWKTITPYLWEERELSDDEWNDLINVKTQKISEKYAGTELYQDAIDLMVCMLNSVNKRQKAIIKDMRKDQKMGAEVNL